MSVGGRADAPRSRPRDRAELGGVISQKSSREATDGPRTGG